MCTLRYWNPHVEVMTTDGEKGNVSLSYLEVWISNA